MAARTHWELPLPFVACFPADQVAAICGQHDFMCMYGIILSFGDFDLDRLKAAGRVQKRTAMTARQAVDPVTSIRSERGCTQVALRVHGEGHKTLDLSFRMCRARTWYCWSKLAWNCVQVAKVLPSARHAWSTHEREREAPRALTDIRLRWGLWAVRHKRVFSANPSPYASPYFSPSSLSNSRQNGNHIPESRREVMPMRPTCLTTVPSHAHAALRHVR